MTIYADNYTATISIEEVNFVDMFDRHWEHRYEEQEEYHAEITVEYFADEACSYYEA